MTPLQDRPLWRLTRHLFSGLFDLGFLSEVAADSFKRMIIGISTAFFSFGLLLARMMAVKYAGLGSFDSPEPYRQALLADHAFILAIPMWIVAFVTLLIGHSLFPDETDFRVLMPLPVTERLVFGAKLVALALFTGVFILGTHAAVAPLFLLMAVGQWAEHAFLLQAAAYGVTSLLASAFTVLAVTALQGLLMMVAPQGRLLTASAALRSVMLCGLVLSLPLVGRLSRRGFAFANGAPWVYVTPPAWFLGVERWLLGDSRSHFMILALIGAAAFAVAAGLALGTYVWLYRRFDRVMLRPAEWSARWQPRLEWRFSTGRHASRPVLAAIRAFTWITLRRSVLHQGIIVALSAAAGALVANSLVAADLPAWLENGEAPLARLIRSVTWAPFALIFAVSLSVRAALLVPIEERANWVFRMAEQDVPLRLEQLGAGAQTLWRLGVVAPAAVVFPVQWLVVGWDAIAALAVALVCGWLFTEILMKDWGRIPFTCSYIPGKGFVPQTFLIGFATYVVFTSTGAGLARFSLTEPSRAWVPTAVLSAAALLLRRRRLHQWKEIPLMFEDQLPTDVNPLRIQ